MKPLMCVLSLLALVLLASRADAQCRNSGNGQCQNLSRSLQTPAVPQQVPVPGGSSAAASSGNAPLQTTFVPSQARGTFNPYDMQQGNEAPLMLASTGGRSSRSVSRSVSRSGPALGDGMAQRRAARSAGRAAAAQRRATFVPSGGGGTSAASSSSS
jgi:hypothetical protein